MGKEGAKINCAIFQKQEPITKHIIDKINGSKDVKDKAEFAEELQKEVDVLLSCQDYKDTSIDCENCRFVANLRKRTADIIVKVKKLA